MKVGFSSFLLNGGQTGIATYIRELVRALQLEADVDELELLMLKKDADLITLSNSNFKKYLLPNTLGHPLANIAWHNTGLRARSAPYDLLHIPSARRIPMIKKTKVVATVHDLAAFSVNGKYDPLRMAYNKKLVPALIRNTDHIIAVSEYTKNDILKFTGYPEHQISVIYSGINHDLFFPVPADEAREKLQLHHGIEKPFFVYVSRLEHPGKNQIRLIEAFEFFKLEHDSDHQLILAGADWHGAEMIRKRAAESPVKNDILFPGFVPFKSLPLLYSACDLMIFPSLFEGFGFPIIEALACGAKVICSNTSSMKEIAKDLIPTFDPARADDLFRCMQQAVGATGSTEQRDRNLKYARTFDWHKTAAEVTDIYRRVSE